MTKDEWLSIGYSNHVIEDVPSDASVRFSVVYAQWFVMKMHKIKRNTHYFCKICTRKEKY